MKFDVVVGNPPYQEEASGTSTSDDPIYNYFYDLAGKVSDKYCLISPARFLFNGGKTPKAWNEKMLNDDHLKVVYYVQKSSEVFPNTDIKGGVSIVMRDAKTTFQKIGIYSSYKELSNITEKVMNNIDFSTIIPIIDAQNKYNLNVVYQDYPELKSRIGSEGKEKRLRQNSFEVLPELFLEQKENELSYKILGLYNKKRVYRFILQKYIEKNLVINKYKVLLPTNGSGAIGEVLSTPLIGTPLIGFTQTFISIGAFDNELEAENCLKYIKSKFARTMLGVLKITQGNTADKWEYVPLQDFTENSDIDWTQSIADIDRQLYKKYNLDETEIAFIEEKVKEMS